MIIKLMVGLALLFTILAASEKMPLWGAVLMLAVIEVLRVWG